MKLQFTLTLVTKEQLKVLMPTKDHSEIQKQLDELEIQNKELTEGIYVGYYFLDGIFNIMTTDAAKNIEEATEQILLYIFDQLKINKITTSDIQLPKLNKLNDVA